MFSISVKRSCIIIAGGDGLHKEIYNTVEVISGSPNFKIELPNLPYKISGCSLFIHNGSLMVCGSLNINGRKCYQLIDGKWKEHSMLNRKKYRASAIPTEKGTFLFGGVPYNSYTYEYLPNDPTSTNWKVGKTQIPGGFEFGCAIEVKSKQQIWLIGGHMKNENRILTFDINSETFQTLPSKLIIERSSFACAFIPGTSKIIVTGGIFGHHRNCITEIIDTEDGSVTIGGSLNIGRSVHAMGIITIEGKERLAVLGGVNGHRVFEDTIEIYDVEKDQWEMANIKLDKPKLSFGCVTVKAQ